MSGNRPHPIIRKLFELLIYGACTAALMVRSWTPPGAEGFVGHELQDAVIAQGLKSYLGGVGLGIVAAPIKFGIVLKSAVCSMGLTQSEPILVRSIKNPTDGFHEGVNGMEFGSLEDHTYATCRLPNCCSEYLRIGISQGLEYV